MKEQLEALVGKTVLNGESSSNTVVKLAKTLNYLEIQLRMIKRDIDDKEIKDDIDAILKNASEMLV